MFIKSKNCSPKALKKRLFSQIFYKLINFSVLILNTKIAFVNLTPNISLRAAKFLPGKTKARVILFIFLFIRQRLGDTLENIITLRFQVLRTFGKYSTQSNSMRWLYPQSRITSCYGRVYITQKQSSLCFYQYFSSIFSQATPKSNHYKFSLFLEANGINLKITVSYSNIFLVVILF